MAIADHRAMVIGHASEKELIIAMFREAIMTSLASLERGLIILRGSQLF